MDRDAIARAQRRRQAEEALEVERDRLSMLEEQIEDLVTGLLGPGIDEQAFAGMSPEDVEIVRGVLDPQSGLEFEDDDAASGEWVEDDEASYDDEEDAEPDEDPAAENEAEIARLEAEIAVGRQRVAALERFIAALGA